MDNEEIIKDFERARNNLKGDKYTSLSKTHERQFGRAYQRMVKAGLKPQIKKKYRGGN